MHCLQYRLYLNPADVDLKNAVEFSWAESTQFDVQNKPKILLAEVDPLYTSDEKQDTDVKVSENTISVGMTGERDKNIAMNVSLHYSIEVTIDEDQDRKVRNCYSKSLCMISFDKAFI